MPRLYTMRRQSRHRRQIDKGDEVHIGDKGDKVHKVDKRDKGD